MFKYYTHTALGCDMIIYDDENHRLIIPPDIRSTDYQQYLAWIAEGNEPEEWKPE